MINYYDTAAAALKDIEAQTTPEAKANKLNAIVQEWATHWHIGIKDENEPKARKCLCNTLELLNACTAERIYMHRPDIDALLEYDGDFMRSLTDCHYYGGDWGMDWICINGEKLDTDKNNTHKRVLLRLCFHYIPQEPQPGNAPQYPWQEIEPQPDLSLLELGDKEEFARAVFYYAEKHKWMVLENGKYKWFLSRRTPVLAYICNCINCEDKKPGQVLNKPFSNAGLFEAYFFGENTNGRILKKAFGKIRPGQSDHIWIELKKVLIPKALEALRGNTPPRL